MSDKSKTTTSIDSCCGSGSSCCSPLTTRTSTTTTTTTTTREEESLKACLAERPVVNHGHDDHDDHHGPKTTTTVMEQDHDHDDDDDKADDDDDVLCLAVVPEDGNTISILDASGAVQSYAYQGGSSSKGGGNNNVRHLCFSSHGNDTDTATDDLLTPCFDEDGNHGMPDEGCFCGLDVPHLHAHLFDPKVCNITDEKNEKGPQKKKSMASCESNLIHLASLTLLPVHDNTTEGGNAHRLLQIPLSKHMPSSECNSKDLLLLSHKKKRSGNIETTVPNRRMYPVQHGDHVDYLVHSTLTDELHLEHPANCNDCGSGGGGTDEPSTDKIHGSFTCIGKRTLSSSLPTAKTATTTMSSSLSSGSSNNKRKKGVRVHFFQVSPRPFSFTNLFEPESERVTAAIRIIINPACCNGTVPCPKSCCSTGICTMMMGASTNLVEAVKKSASCCLTGSCSKCCTNNNNNNSKKVAAAPDVSKVEENLPQKSCCSKGKCSSSSSNNKSVEPNESSIVDAPRRVVIHPDCCKSDGVGPRPKPCCATGTCSTNMSSALVEAEKPACCSSGKCNNKVAATEAAKESPPPEKSCCSKGECTNSNNKNKKSKESMLEAPPGTRVMLHPNCCDSDGVGPCPKPCCTTGSRSANISGTAVVTAMKSAGCSSKSAVAADGTKESSNNIINTNDTCCSKGKCGKGVVEKDCSNETFSNVTDGVESLKGDVAVQETKTTSGRSSFYVAKICCASEIPAINSIVNPMDGTRKVSINVTTKMLYVDHDTDVVSAGAICDALNSAGFNAHVESDAGRKTGSMSAFVTSVISLEDETNNPDDEAQVVPSTMEDLTAALNSLNKAYLQTFEVDCITSTTTITILHNPFFLSAESVLEQLQEKTGLGGRLVRDGAAQKNWNAPIVVEEEAVDESSAGIRPTVILSGMFWMISMLCYIGGNWEYLNYVALLSVAFGLPPIAVKAIRQLRRGQFDTNCLMVFAAIGAVGLTEFTEAAAVTFLFAISEWLEVRATTRARKALSAIVRLRPDTANLVHPSTRGIVVVPADSVPLGALVSVRTGDKIPCDGVVVEGRSTVDESSLTGESRPVRKGPNDNVSGGTINSGQTQIMVRTTSTADDSAVARLIRLVEEAQANRSETEQFVDEFARVYTPIVVFIALLMCTIPWAWGREVGATWTHNGLVLIVMACPCALIISTPVAYVAGLAATAQKGILIKGGAHLESLGLVKTVCFDKTGTLTQGNFQLLHLNVVGGTCTRKQVLEFLSLMEERASHPLAQAIVQAARNEGVSIPKELHVTDHTFLAGEGVSGVIDGSVVHVGNFRLFHRMGLVQALSENEKKVAENWEHKGGTVGFMSIEGHGIVCSYCVADAVRTEAAEVVGKLNRMGVRVIMLTGDNHNAAYTIGGQVGLSREEIKSGLLPEEKLSIVTGMKDGRKGGRSVFVNLFSSKKMVLMCGDGVNDAPALAIADVGVAMGAGAALAMDTADVTLLDSNLRKLVDSISMGRRVIRKIKENIVFSVAVKLLVLGFALVGKAHLWAAIASDVGAMILVTLNGMMLLPLSKVSHLKARKIEDDDEEGDHTNRRGISQSG